MKLCLSSPSQDFPQATNEVVCAGLQLLQQLQLRGELGCSLKAKLWAGVQGGQGGGEQGGQQRAGGGGGEYLNSSMSKTLSFVT